MASTVVAAASRSEPPSQLVDPSPSSSADVGDRSDSFNSSANNFSDNEAQVLSLLALVINVAFDSVLAAFAIPQIDAVMCRFSLDRELIEVSFGSSVELFETDSETYELWISML